MLPSKTRVNKAGDRLAGFLSRELALSPEELGEEIEVVWAWRGQHAYPLAQVMPGLRNWTDKYSSSGIRPAQRLKRLPQMIAKLLREPGMKLARMQDVGGCRAVLASAREVEAVHQKVVDRWGLLRPASDYRNHPRSSGYRALHLVVAKRDRISDEERPVEIQLRTLQEHRWAETVTHTGNRLGYALRDGQGPAELVEYFRMASELLWLGGRGERPEPEFVARFADLREQVRPYFERRS